MLSFIVVFSGEGEADQITSQGHRSNRFGRRHCARGQLMPDDFTGSALLAHSAADLDWPARWVDTADPLHFGNFGGLLMKALRS